MSVSTVSKQTLYTRYTYLSITTRKNLNATPFFFCYVFLGSFLKVEFAVQMTGPDCVQDLKETLKNVGTVDIDQKAGRVVINSNIPWIEIQEKIEHTGRKAVLSGFGGNFTFRTFHPFRFRNERQTIKLSLSQLF